MNKNLKGFLPEKEIADSNSEDYLLGSSRQPNLKGMSDAIAGIGAALYAWTSPINGVYPRTEYKFNHASLLVSEKTKTYLPDGTVQRGREDWMNCTSNSPCNDYEAQFNYALDKGLFTPKLVEWFKEIGFINSDSGKFEIADAWSSIGSGTTRQGNSLKAPLEFIRKNGIVPKSKMLDLKTMTWDEYHNKKRMTPDLKVIANEILKYISFRYEKVNYVDFPKFTGKTKWDDFDSYTDPVDGDFIKRLAPDYKLMRYGYHLTINQIGEPQSKDENMQRFYKEKDSPKVYQIGIGDGLFHHLVDEPVFKGLYGGFSDVEIVELDSIPQEKIGFTLYNKKSISNLISNVFGNTNIPQKYPLLGSSADPDKIALSVKGLTGLIVALGLLSGVDIDGTVLETLLFQVATGISAITTLIGFGRKFYLKFKK